MYAIFETGGKQVKANEGEIVYIEKLDVNEGEDIVFDKVLLCGEAGEVKIGAPYVEGASVSGKVLKNGKSAKIMVFKYKSKKNYRRRQGHRQPYTKVQITAIVG